MFACLASASATPQALLDAARAFSPRVERREHAVILDVSGLGRIIGDPPAVWREMTREARARGIDGAVAIAATWTAAMLLAHAGRATVIASGEERQAVEDLPVPMVSAVGEELAEHLPTLSRWGLRTLGEVAALDPADLHARLGAAGLTLHRIACGRDDGALVPHVDAARFEASIDLEWPIDALEPLSFVFARLLEPLSAALERADRGASAIALVLTLVTREVVVRRLELPAPMCNARTFRTLLLLQLESQPVTDAIDRVAIRLEPTPARILQYSLLERARPSPETLSTLVARLEALMGAGRVGAPALVDSHEPGAFALRPLGPGAWGLGPGDKSLGPSQAPSPKPQAPILRRFRLPVPARVAIEHGRPVRVTTSRRTLGGGRVIECAGPWRASGGWWSGALISHDVKTNGATTAPSANDPPSPGLRRGLVEARRAEAGARQVLGVGPQHKWNKDEWDVALPDGMYRIYRDRDAGGWFIEGVLD